MKLRVRKPRARFRALHIWHNWFAWHPVRVPTKGKMSGMTLVWLEKMRRTGTYETCWYESWWVWEYKQIEE